MTTTAPERPALAVEGGRYLEAQRDAPLGGQAVLEGVMMRGVRHWAVAVRKPVAPAQGEPAAAIAGDGRRVPVPQLLLETDEEKRVADAARARREKRLKQRAAG